MAMKQSLCALGLTAFAAYAAPAFAADTIRITVDKLAFAPAEVSAHVGDTIEWTNKDFVVHTATARNKEWDVALPAKGGNGRVTLASAGEIEYFCRFHPNMKGRISVTAP